MSSIPGYDFGNPPPGEPQWAWSYYRTQIAHAKDFRQWRSQLSSMTIRLSNGRARTLCRATDSEIEDAAHVMARQDLERARNDWLSAEVASRRASKRGTAF